MCRRRTGGGRPASPASVPSLDQFARISDRHLPLMHRRLAAEASGLYGLGALGAGVGS